MPYSEMRCAASACESGLRRRKRFRGARYIFCPARVKAMFGGVWRDARREKYCARRAGSIIHGRHDP